MAHKASTVALLSILFACLLLISLTSAVNEQKLFEHIATEQLIEPLFHPRSADAALPPQTPSCGDLSANFAYSHNDAQSFSRLSAAAYCSPASIAGTSKRLDLWSCQACVDSGMTLNYITPFRIAIADLYGYIGYNKSKNQVVLVFTGSRSIINWIYNLDAKFIDWNGQGLVHSGFMKSWLAARPTVCAMLDSYFTSYPSAKLVISGHSLGGAVAAFATIDFLTATSIQMYEVMGLKYVKMGNAFDNVNDLVLLNSEFATELKLNATKYQFGGPTYTFGQPRIGDNIFANWAMSKIGKTQIYRVTHYQDIVPHMPPLALFKTAQHMTSEIYYDKAFSPSYVTCDVNPEDSNCSNRHLLPASIDDHTNYFNYHLGTDDTAC